MIRPILFLILITLSACSDSTPPDLAALQKSREALQIENSRLQEKADADALLIRNLEEDLRIKTKDWTDRSGKIAEESRARQEQVEALSTDNQQLRAQLEGFQKAEELDARTEAKGSQIPLLKTRDGESYKNVTIRSVVPDGLHILHDSGATKVPFTQLDSSWGNRFGYNTKEAETYAKEQARQKAAVQKAQWEALQAQQDAVGHPQNRKTSGTREKETDPRLRNLASLRGELYSELQGVAASVKGNLGISRTEPENSACFSNNLITLRLSRARDLRAQINSLKNDLGTY